MDAPFFSIVTVTLNAAETLPTTAGSIVAQTDDDFEWIVIDGASTDDTRAVAEPYQREGRDRFVSEPDQGIYYAMNKGLRLSQGRFIVFLNAGDRLAAEDTLCFVRAECRDEVDVVHGDVEFRTPRSGIVLRRSRSAEDGVNRQVFASHQSVFVRRAVHLRHPFETRYRIAADYAAFAALHAGGCRFSYLPIPLATTTIDEHSLSFRLRAKMLWEDFYVDRDVLGHSWFAAFGNFAVRRIKFAGVSALLSLPGPIFTTLPHAITRRLY